MTHFGTNEHSRRNFIKNSAIGIAGMGIAAPFTSALAVDKTSLQTKKPGIALVGLGSYSTNQLAPALLETKHCYLAGIVTGTKEKEKVWAEKYNIPAKNIYNYDNFESIASNDDIAIIYVVLPNSMHAEFTIKAAKAGKHVICEKPMAVSVKECNDMIKACKDNNVKLSIGYRLQFSPYHEKMINLNKERPFGKVTYVSSQFGFKIGDPTQWRLKKDLAGGGALMDVGIYCVQAARYTYGQEPVALTAQEFKTDRKKFKEVDETITWQMEFPDGSVSNHTTSYSFGTNHLIVSTEKARGILMPAYSYDGLKGSLNNEILDFDAPNQQAVQMDNFALNVLKNTESIISGEEGLKDMKVLEAVYKSLASGNKRVNI